MDYRVNVEALEIKLGTDAQGGDCVVGQTEAARLGGSTSESIFNQRSGDAGKSWVVVGGGGGWVEMHNIWKGIV